MTPPSSTIPSIPLPSVSSPSPRPPSVNPAASTPPSSSPSSPPPIPPAANPPAPPPTSRGHAGNPAPHSASSGRPVNFSPFRGVFWKELRENLKYAIFLELALAVFALFILWSATDGFRNVLHEDSALLNQNLQALSAFACPVAALLLALGQVFNERAFDLRAFGWHRAMTPSRLFWAKSTAAITLYAIVIGGPQLIFIAYAAFAHSGGLIFDIRFTEPYAADFLVGLAFYFAGFLTAQRQARWYVSKLLPLPVAIGAVVCSFALPEFWQAVLMTLLLTALLAAAAWHNFIHGGVDTALGQPRDATPDPAASAPAKISSRLGRWAMPLVMALGLTTVSTVWLAVEGGVIAWANESGNVNRGQFGARPEFPRPLHAERYALLPDGTPARVVEDLIGPSATQPDQHYEHHVTWIDMQGQTHPEMGSIESTFPTQADMGFGVLTPGPPTPTDPETSFWQPNFPDPYRDGRRLFSVVTEGDHGTVPGSPLAQRWYYLQSRRYFIGLDRPTHQLAGTVGRTGLLPASAVPQPFGEDSHYAGGAFLFDGKTVYQVYFGDVNPPSDIPPHDAQPYFTSPSGEPIRAVHNLGVFATDDGDDHGGRPRLWDLFLTDTQIYFTKWVHSERQMLFSLPVEHSADSYQIILRHHVDDQHISVWYQPITGQGTQYVSTFTDEGKLVNQATLPPLPQPPPPELTATAHQVLATIAVLDSFRNPLFIDALQRAYLHIMAGNRYDYHGFLFFAMFVHEDLPIPFEYYAALALPILLAAAATLFLTRRCRYTRLATALWTLATLLLGPVGLLTFLFTQPLPTRLPCPHCKKKRLTTRTTCEHCTAPFAPPPQNGTEVFAP